MKLSNLFRTKTSIVYENACNKFRALWESCGNVEIERMNSYDYIRMSGYINGVHYQTHINHKELAPRCRWQIVRDNDTEIIRAFALSCACADMGLFYKDFAHLEKDLILNYTR